MSDDDVSSLERQLDGLKAQFDGLKARVGVLQQSDERLRALQRIVIACGGTGTAPLTPSEVVDWVEKHLAKVRADRDIAMQEATARVDEVSAWQATAWASERLIKQIKAGELHWNGVEWVKTGRDARIERAAKALHAATGSSKPLDESVLRDSHFFSARVLEDAGQLKDLS